MHKDVELVTTCDRIEVVVDAEDFDQIRGWVPSRAVFWAWPDSIRVEGDYTVFSGEIGLLRGETYKWERKVLTRSMMDVL